MIQPCTLNPCLSAFEAREGMHYFDATPIAPVGNEMMINLKPVRRHTWSYHAVKAWYFDPSLKHYHVIKTTNKAGLVRITDMWKYNHHAIKTPTVTPVDRIIKATKKIATEIECHNYAPQDKLEVIEDLQAIITGNSAPTSRQATEQQVEHPTQWHLESDNIAEPTATVRDFDPPRLCPKNYTC